MGIPIPGKDGLYAEIGPRFSEVFIEKCIVVYGIHIPLFILHSIRIPLFSLYGSAAQTLERRGHRAW